MNEGGRDSSGRGYVPVVKFIGGLCPRCKKQLGDYVHFTKYGGLCPPLRK